ncbi:hypothetical protein PHYPO_G00015310 [Pangasianodon hypophthalmus]|uniref:Uncharacterized protein n=1 Tax=Pangasianodon hypophthalmus TaxID=310915 RepID=A0A5N5N5B6_PANHP|nr:hypothetical protein PHYPO_G00015310 [Pangasianodon hypophthalmus]
MNGGGTSAIADITQTPTVERITETKLVITVYPCNGRFSNAAAPPPLQTGHRVCPRGASSPPGQISKSPLTAGGLSVQALLSGDYCERSERGK